MGAQERQRQALAVAETFGDCIREEQESGSLAGREPYAVVQNDSVLSVL